MAKRKTTTEDHSVKRMKPNINIDAPLKYLYDFERDADTSTRDLLRNARQLEVPYYHGDKWNSKYNLPEPKEVQEFASNIYNNYEETNSSKIKLKGCWKLLYRAQGSMFFSSSRDGFYGELYFNTENHYLLLAIKGTTVPSPGDLIADIKNVVLNKKGGALNSAITFAEKVRQLMLRFKCKPMLIITGHSLGGYLAQIITFTITYFLKGEDDLVQSREHPSDEFGIYTTVFDSPAALSQMCSIDPSDILSMKRFDLPITNFVKDTNKINSNSWIGKHSGQVLAISGFENLDQPGFFGKIVASLNPIRSHAISNFDKVNVQLSKKVVHLKNKETETYDSNKIHLMFFSPKEFELLHKFLILAPMCAELHDKLPTFTLSNSCLTLADENVPAEEFIPRAHQFLSQYGDELDSGKFEGKQIVDMMVFNLWRAEMLEDAHELYLNEEWKQRVEQWPDGTKIGVFESYEEMRFVGCLLHNSIPRCFHYDYLKFVSLDQEQVFNFATTTKATLVLIVKEKNQIIHHKKYKEVKIMYLVLDSDAHENMDNLIHSALDENSQKQLENKELDFMGHKVTSKEVFGKNSFENLQIWSIYNFHVKSELKDELFYCDQEIASENEKSEFQSATEFAHEISKGELKFVLISSDAGMGKSTALMQIAKTLQNQLPNYWIVHLNLFSIQKELHEEKGKLYTLAAAIEFVRNAALGKRKEDEVLKKVFDWKVEAREMVLLFDSLDEICPTHRETADILLKFLRETELQIVVTTRPHEGKNYKDAKIFRVAPINYRDRDKFVSQKCQMMGKLPPSDISSWFKKIYNERYDYDFWSVPLILNMAITIFDPSEALEAVSENKQKTNIFETFIKKSISNTLEKKFDLKISNATSFFSEKFDLYNKIIEILALCTIFHSGEVALDFQNEIETYRDFINRFDMATADDCNKVVFLHRSFAEYLVARLFVQNLQKKFAKKNILDDNQLKCILFKYEFRDTRKHICTILAMNSPNSTSFSGCIINGEESLLLKILIEEDRYELYMAYKYLLCSQLNKTMRVLKDFIMMPCDVSPLCYALVKARDEFIQQLINDGAQFEAILCHKDALHVAIEKGLYKEVINHFDSLKSNINEKRESGLHKPQTPLQIAAKKGSREMVAFLIEKGADVNYEDGNKRSALFYAIEGNSAEIIELLIAKNAKSAKALNMAAQLNRKEMFDIIYKKYTPSEYKVERLRESLFNAVQYGHLEFVKQLTDFPEAQLREVEENVTTLLHIAAENGQLHCMDFILEYQQPQSIDVRDENGRTPLMRACCGEEKNIKTVEWLLKMNANVNAVDNEGKSCLHHAAHTFGTDTVEFLINAGAEINLKDKKGWTPLFYAPHETYDSTMLEYFLEETSADANVTDNEGNTCLHTSIKYDDHDNIMALLEHLPVNCENLKGETPLHLAAYEGQVSVVELLLQEGAKHNVAASDGKTILRLAKKMNKLKYETYADSEESNNESYDESEESSSASYDESEEANYESYFESEESNNESYDESEESNNESYAESEESNNESYGEAEELLNCMSEISNWRYIVRDNNSSS